MSTFNYVLKPYLVPWYDPKPALPSWEEEPDGMHPQKQCSLSFFFFYKEYLKSIYFIYTLKSFIFNKCVRYKDKNDNSQDPIPMMNMSFPDPEFTIIKVWKYLLPSNHCFCYCKIIIVFVLKRYTYLCNWNLIEKIKQEIFDLYV